MKGSIVQMILLVDKQSKARGRLEVALHRAGFNVSAVPVTGSQTREIALLISDAARDGLSFATETVRDEGWPAVFPSDSCVEPELGALGWPEASKGALLETLLIEVRKIMSEIDPHEVS